MRSIPNRQNSQDLKFLVYLIVLVVFGLAALTSASATVGFARFNDAYFFIKRQIVFGLVPGVILFLILAKINYLTWKKLSWPIYGLAIFLLLLVFVPGIGLVINGSRSWLSVAGANIQPAEMAKLGLIIMLAHLLSSRQEKSWDNWQTSLLPILAIVSPSVLLVVMQPDIGTVSILVVIIFVMLYLAHVPSRYLIILGLLGALIFVGIVIAAPYRVQRMTTFLHPELDPQGTGYQVNQAFLAVGSGGWWGLGYGNSRQKHQYLPEAHADSIFAIIGEEGGFFISTGLVILIILLGWRGFYIAKRSSEEFGYLLVSGIVVWLLWQSLLNIGAMVGALPLTGVPLPFVSHGGSALITVLAAAGVVLNVSKQAKN